MPIILPQQLTSSSKILFLTHLAIGDFTYMQPYFKKLSENFPHLKIDLWLDEARGKWFLWPSKPPKKASVFDWVLSCSFFNKVYLISHSRKSVREALERATDENYPLVVSLATLRPSRYADYARKISPKGIVLGMDTTKRRWNKKLGGVLCPTLDKSRGGWHVTELYASWFKQLFGLELPEKERFPFIDVPEKWIDFAREKFALWGLWSDESKSKKVIFINAFGSNKKRSWPLENVIGLIKRLNDYKDIAFIVNMPPGTSEEINKNWPSNVFPFTASKNFFQLPAVLSLCGLVVSVETSTMHLAIALGKSLIALMRSKNPEWVPYGLDEKNIIFAKANSWIENISVDDVEKKLKTTFSTYSE